MGVQKCSAPIEVALRRQQELPASLGTVLCVGQHAVGVRLVHHQVISVLH